MVADVPRLAEVVENAAAKETSRATVLPAGNVHGVATELARALQMEEKERVLGPWASLPSWSPKRLARPDAEVLVMAEVDAEAEVLVYADVPNCGQVPCLYPSVEVLGVDGAEAGVGCVGWAA